MNYSFIFSITLNFFFHLSLYSQSIEDFYDSSLKPFYHGVASGDPTETGVVIWTRVTPDDPGPISVDYLVSLESNMSEIFTRGTFRTGKERDYTVKIELKKLKANTTYYYQFQANGKKSIVGRTKTAPANSSGQVKFAVVSCSHFEWGYFSGYKRIAERKDLTAVIHLGDYIYEYPDDYQYSSPSLRDERVVFPKHETVTLEDYRLRYSTYRLDPNLREAHRLHPFINVWDDHELANDAWTDGAQNHQPENEGLWKKRKQSARKAYFEWIPIRESKASKSIYRHLSFGKLVDLFMIDTRIEGRNKQCDNITSPELVANERTLLGDTQKAWLKNKLNQSQATWKLIGNQVMFSEFNVWWAVDPKNPKFDTPTKLESVFLDIWDGYPSERLELINFISKKNIQNVVFLTGDFHSSFASEIVSFEPKEFPQLGRVMQPIHDYDRDNGAGAVAVEFVTPSLSAANFDENISPEKASALEFQFNKPIKKAGGIVANPHMKFVDLDRHGYFVVTLDSQKAEVDYFFLDDVTKKFSREELGKRLRVKNGKSFIQVIR